MPTLAIDLIAACALSAVASAAFGMQSECSARSGPQITPVLELYTSEGCSSCPPADQWVSALKGKDMVVQAFHVGYWDHIGWVDRFAAPAHTTRQRDVAAKNRLRNIYTPQLVLGGRDWPKWASGAARLSEPRQNARADLSIKLLADDHFEASVTPLAGAGNWTAYWTVTEHGHRSRVQAGENAGELLKHDFVVRQYTPAGDYKSSAATPSVLRFRSIAATPGHSRQINLVVADTHTGQTLQAISLACAEQS